MTSQESMMQLMYQHFSGPASLGRSSLGSPQVHRAYVIVMRSSPVDNLHGTPSEHEGGADHDGVA